MHKNSLKIMGQLLDKYAPKQGLCVDVGSFDVNGTYRPLVESRGLKYVGLDIAEGPNVDHVIEPYGVYTALPHATTELPNLVISGQCVEHVEFPWNWIRDVARILHDDVPLILIAPAVWREHRYPLDCYRYLPDGMRALFKWAGMECMEAGMEQTDAFHADCWGVGKLA